MKITPNIYKLSLPERSPQTNTQTNDTSKNAKPSSVNVALSATARHLLLAESTAGDVDINRVNALREAIANGTMEIDTTRIAKNLLTSTRELLK